MTVMKSSMTPCGEHDELLPRKYKHMKASMARTFIYFRVKSRVVEFGYDFGEKKSHTDSIFLKVQNAVFIGPLTLSAHAFRDEILNVFKRRIFFFEILIFSTLIRAFLGSN